MPWHSPTPENIERFTEAVARIRTKDGKEYGGDTYTMRLLDENTVRLYQSPYFGGRYHHILIDEIEGIFVGLD